MTSAMQPQSATPAKRILVVEDELMIRMLLEDMLGELGYTVAAEAARIEEALDAAKNADFDLAILDVNLNGQPISPVADALVARGMPFVFATGYGERGLPQPYRRPPTPKKPFPMDGLQQMLQTALDRAKNQSTPPDAHIGDPVISIAATVLTRVDLQPVLAVAALVRHRDAPDLPRRAVREVDVDEHVTRNSGGEHAPDDIGCEADRRLPVRRLAAA